MVALATIALAVSFLFRTDHSDENLYHIYEVATGVAYLVAGTLLAASAMFFMVEKYWEDGAEFDKIMLIPVIPGLILAFQASELFVGAVYVDYQSIFYWTAALGIINCFFIPRYKTFSLHATFKVLSIVLYLATYLTIWFDGPWFTIATVIAALFSLFSLVYSYGVSYKY